MTTILLTPGPLTTSLATKQAMLRDWGSWDAAFNAITAEHLQATCVDDRERRRHARCVPLQGSGTFSVEAAIGTSCRATARCWCRTTARTASASCKILRVLGREHVDPSTIAEDEPVAAGRCRRRARDRSGDHPRRRRCTARPAPASSTRWRRSPRSCARHGKGLIVDAMSSFGALDDRRARRSASTR